MDLQGAVLRAPGRGSGRHRGAAACARRDEPRARRGAARARDRPGLVVGHSVGEFSALGAAQSLSRRATRSRSCASAGSRWPRPRRQHPGSMAAILGLADEAVEALCHKITNVWPANYNCPGQLVISGETPSVDEACDEATREGARRAIKLRVSGAFHSPLVAARGRAAAAGDRARRTSRGPTRAVHVDRHREARGRAALPRAARRAADRAGPVHAGGARADRPTASRRSWRSGPATCSAVY